MLTLQFKKTSHTNILIDYICAHFQRFEQTQINHKFTIMNNYEHSTLSVFQLVYSAILLHYKIHQLTLKKLTHGEISCIEL